MRKHLIKGIGYQVFDDPEKLEKDVNNAVSGAPVRFPIPGEAGTRNAFRGDGFFGIDSGLNKTWQVWERRTHGFRRP